jgi:hypothetical protein
MRIGAEYEAAETDHDNLHIVLHCAQHASRTRTGTGSVRKSNIDFLIQKPGSGVSISAWVEEMTGKK